MAARQSYASTRLTPYLLASLSIHLAGFGISALRPTSPQYNVTPAPPPSIAVSLVEEVPAPVIEPVVEPIVEPEPVTKAIEAVDVTEDVVEPMELSPMAIDHPQIDAPQVKVFKKFIPKLKPKPEVVKKKRPTPTIKKPLKTPVPEKKIQPKKNITRVQSSAQMAAADSESGAKSEPKPIKRVNPRPKYPKRAIRRGWEGTVTLRVRVSRAGDPLDIQIEESSGRKILDDAAVSTVKQWKFEPARAGRMTFESWATIPVEFRLTDAR